jgi:hypothetical protein
MCAEYGEDPEQLNGIGRPHFHALIFNHGFLNDRYEWREENGNMNYRSPLLEGTWGKGHCEIADLTLDSAAYVARYTMKKINGQQAEDHYLRLDPYTAEVVKIQPEQSRQSRRPGIGRNWYEKYGSDANKGFLTLNGKKLPIPKFYERIMSDLDPVTLEQLKEERAINPKVEEQDILDRREKIQKRSMKTR